MISFFVCLILFNIGKKMIVKSELILVSALLVNQIITSVGTREKVEVSNINSIVVFLYCI